MVTVRASVPPMNVDRRPALPEFVMTLADRRTFLRKSTLIAGGAIVAPSLSGLVACNDVVSPLTPSGKILPRAGRGSGGYGPLVPAGSELALPAGFQYV